MVSVTALLGAKSYIDTMGGLLACPVNSGTCWPLLNLVPPGRPTVQEDEDAPGVLGCVVVGIGLFDVWAREWRHVELRLEALGKEW